LPYYFTFIWKDWTVMSQYTFQVCCLDWSRRGSDVLGGTRGCIHTTWPLGLVTGSTLFCLLEFWIRRRKSICHLESLLNIHLFPEMSQILPIFIKLNLTSAWITYSELAFYCHLRLLTSSGPANEGNLAQWDSHSPTFQRALKQGLLLLETLLSRVDGITHQSTSESWCLVAMGTGVGQELSSRCLFSALRGTWHLCTSLWFVVFSLVSLPKSWSEIHFLVVAGLDAWT
jgi:hypothetical protein